MKWMLLTYFLFLIVHNSFAQDTVLKSDIDSYKCQPKIIPEYFILGTLTFARSWSWEMPWTSDSVVDHYYLYSRPVMDYMKKYIKTSLGISVTVDSLNGFLYSRKFCEILYSMCDTNRALKNSDNLSEEEICSFLSGALYNEGGKVTDSIYRIMPYLRSKNNVTYDFLKRAGCDRIYTRYYKDGVPDLTVYYFLASPKLKMYFDFFENEMTSLVSFREMHSKFVVDQRKAKNERANKLRDFFKIQ